MAKFGRRGHSLTYCYPPTCEPKSFPLFAEPESSHRWNWWRYRRILAKELFAKPEEWMDVTLVNWPQNDYLLGNLIDANEEETCRIYREARELSLSLAYWLQNDAPRPDGGCGYPGIHLRPDVMGTTDGLAKAPYIRESRRIQALFTVSESHIGFEAREGRWPDPFYDLVGVGFYRIDLHPSTNGKNYIDIPSFPYQIPLGALIPSIRTNLIAAAKNIGTTHITNGCYRLHPTEWNIGEAAGTLAAYCHIKGCTPHDTYRSANKLWEFQDQ